MDLTSSSYDCTNRKSKSPHRIVEGSERSPKKSHIRMIKTHLNQMDLNIRLALTIEVNLCCSKLGFYV
ncbi:hypothetical protein SADUNF_Sadunf16G0117900 [Salix dunnii]|uniref:Uncharacterized protein n=1 Tax=Salix dunnii TaxID=1413687 RepID=A0A835MQ09_9ROSI|nr:hypothetical protein SADUNF_Sadunf16G0117900 [Salix dunnii]